MVSEADFASEARRLRILAFVTEGKSNDKLGEHYNECKTALTERGIAEIPGQASDVVQKAAKSLLEGMEALEQTQAFYHERAKGPHHRACAEIDMPLRKYCVEVMRKPESQNGPQRPTGDILKRQILRLHILKLWDSQSRTYQSHERGDLTRCINLLHQINKQRLSDAVGIVSESMFAAAYCVFYGRKEASQERATNASGRHYDRQGITLGSSSKTLGQQLEDLAPYALALLQAYSTQNATARKGAAAGLGQKMGTVPSEAHQTLTPLPDVRGRSIERETPTGISSKARSTSKKAYGNNVPRDLPEKQAVVVGGLRDSHPHRDTSPPRQTHRQTSTEPATRVPSGGNKQGSNTSVGPETGGQPSILLRPLRLARQAMDWYLEGPPRPVRS